jgi:hypothetical protein
LHRVEHALVHPDAVEHAVEHFVAQRDAHRNFNAHAFPRRKRKQHGEQLGDAQHDGLTQRERYRDWVGNVFRDGHGIRHSVEHAHAERVGEQLAHEQPQPWRERVGHGQRFGHGKLNAVAECDGEHDGECDGNWHADTERNGNDYDERQFDSHCFEIGRASCRDRVYAEV